MKNIKMALALLPFLSLICCNYNENLRSSNVNFTPNNNSDSSINTFLLQENEGGASLKLKKFNNNLILSDSTLDSAKLIVRINVKRNHEISMNEIMRLIEWKNKKEITYYVIGNDKSSIIKYDTPLENFIKTLEVDSLIIENEKITNYNFALKLNIYSKNIIGKK